MAALYRRAVRVLIAAQRHAAAVRPDTLALTLRAVVLARVEAADEKRRKDAEAADDRMRRTSHHFNGAVYYRVHDPVRSEFDRMMETLTQNVMLTVISALGPQLEFDQPPPLADSPPAPVSAQHGGYQGTTASASGPSTANDGGDARERARRAMFGDAPSAGGSGWKDAKRNRKWGGRK